MVLAAPPSDTSLWLHNKLGTSHDSWTGAKIVSQLNPSILDDIIICFSSLQPQVKIKFLLSLLQTNHRNLQAWKDQLKQIILIAKEDVDPWVIMLAETMKTFPETGQINTDISYPENNARIFKEVVAELKRSLSKCSLDSQSLALPMACNYLNKNAFLSVVGSQPQASKHFTLKKKPKAVNLRAELLAKSEEAQKKMKSVEASIGNFPTRKPTMPRKMGDNLDGLGKIKPLSTNGFNRTPKVPSAIRSDPKKATNVKILDITEQPLQRSAIKFKKKQEIVDAKKHAAEAKLAKVAQINAEKERQRQERISSRLQKVEEKSQARKVQREKKQTTPLYAAELSGTNSFTFPPLTSTINPLGTKADKPTGPNPSLPSYFPPMATTLSQQVQPKLQTTSLDLTSLNNNASLTTLFPNGTPPKGLKLIALPPQGIVRPIPNPASLLIRSNSAANSTIQPLLTNAQGPQQNIYTPLPQVTQIALTKNTSQPSQENVSNTSLSRSPLVITSAPQQVPLSTTNNQPNSISSNSLLLNQYPLRFPTPNLISNQQSLIDRTNSANSRKGLTLTKEQMTEAQEMFSNANRVTRPEKALMLGFMAGSRENPCPHLGHVVTIKLAEHQENVLQADATYLTMIVETHFQMNYLTGEWKRLKKYRNLPQL